MTTPISPRLEDSAINVKAPTLRGAITRVSGPVIEGWVYDEAAPEQRFVIALYHLGEPVALAYANHFHKHAPGDGLHGFHIVLDDAQRDMIGTLTLAPANAPNAALDQTHLPALSQAHESESGRVEWQPGLVLRGQLVEPSAPQKPLQVRVMYQGRQIAEATPQHWLDYHDQRVQGAFVLNLPLWLADGQRHTLYVMDNHGRELNGSPLTVQEWPNGLVDWFFTLAPQLPDRTQELLKQQLGRYERWLPRAVGMSQYPQWRKAFYSKPAMKGSRALPALQRGERGSALGILWLDHAPSTLPKMPDVTLLHRVVDHATQQDPDRYRAVVEELAGQCEIITQLHGDDTLDTAAAQLAWQAMKAQYEAQILYTDFDIPAEQADQPRQPALLPAWDPERQWAQDLLGGGLCLVRCSLLKDAQYPATHPEDFSHAAFEALHHAGHPESSVLHLPRIVRHRATSWPTVSETQAKRLQTRLERIEPNATLRVNPHYPTLYRVSRTLDTWPDITLIVPTRDALALLKRCIETIAEHTDYPGNVTLMVVNNHSQQPDTLAYFETLRTQAPQPLGRGKLHTRVLDYPHPFNYAAINNAAVEQCESELIALVNNDIEALHPEWLCAMAAHLMRDGVGAVGAKLLWPNGMVQHGGVIGGQYGGLAGHVGNHWHEEDAGYLGMNQLTQRFSMVTAACLLMRKADYHAVGGLNARDFAVNFNDVDLCLKLRRRGLSIVWTPEARLIHAESATRGKDEAPEKAARAQREMAKLRERWSHALLHDPAYNPSLALDVYTPPFTGLALPPRELSHMGGETDTEHDLGRIARSNQLPV